MSAINKLGCGIIDTVAMVFSHAFWSDATVLGCPSKNFYFLNLYNITQQPTLLAVFSGHSTQDVEKETDVEIVDKLMAYLNDVCIRKYAKIYSP